MTQPSVRQLAAEISGLKRRVKKVERPGPQLPFSSIEDGTVPVYDLDGQNTTIIGKQPDGTWGAVTVAGPNPPRPAALNVVPEINGFDIEVTGLWDPAIVDETGQPIVAPMDFKLYEVHGGTDPEMSAVFFSTLAGEVTNARGGHVFMSGLPDVDYYFRAVARTLPGKTSDASPVVGPFRVRKLAAADIDIDLSDIGGTTIYYNDFSDPPVDPAEGSFWLIGPTNTPAAFVDGEWVEVRDEGVVSALEAAQAATTAAQNAANVADDAQAAADTAAQQAQAAENAAAAAQGAADTATTTATDAATVAGNASTAAGNAVTAAGNAVTAAGNATTAANSAVLAGAINKNPTFSDWTLTSPAGWATLTAAPTKETSLARTPPNAARWAVTAAGNQAGMTATHTGALADLPLNVQYVVVEVDFMLVSGALAGAGVMLDWTGMTGTNREILSLAAEVPAPQLSKWHRVSKVLRRPPTATGTQTGWLATVGANVAAIGGAVKNIVVDRVGIRPATVEEVSAYRVRSFAADNIEGNTITGTTVQTAAPGAATRMAMDGVSGLVAQTAGVTKTQITPGGKLTTVDATITGLLKTAEGNGSRIEIEQNAVAAVTSGAQFVTSSGSVSLFGGVGNVVARLKAAVKARNVDLPASPVYVIDSIDTTLTNGSSAVAPASLTLSERAKGAGGYESAAIITADVVEFTGKTRRPWATAVSTPTNYSANVNMNAYALLSQMFLNGIVVAPGKTLEVEWRLPRLILPANTGTTVQLLAVKTGTTQVITQLDVQDYSVGAYGAIYLPARLSGEIESLEGGTYNIAVEAKSLVSQAIAQAGNVGPVTLKYRVI